MKHNSPYTNDVENRGPAIVETLSSQETADRENQGITELAPCKDNRKTYSSNTRWQLALTSMWSCYKIECKRQYQETIVCKHASIKPARNLLSCILSLRNDSRITVSVDQLPTMEIMLFVSYTIVHTSW